MKHEPVVVERTYQAPIEKVWKAITDKNDMKHWYFEFSEFKLEIGFEFQFEGGPDDRRYLHLCRITDIVPLRKLAYTWRYDGHQGNSTVTFELFPESNNTTRLKLTHEGLETFPDMPDFAPQNFVAGWTEIIGENLKNFVEKT